MRYTTLSLIVLGDIGDSMIFDSSDESSVELIEGFSITFLTRYDWFLDDIFFGLPDLGAEVKFCVSFACLTIFPTEDFDTLKISKKN